MKTIKDVHKIKFMLKMLKKLFGKKKPLKLLDILYAMVF